MSLKKIAFGALVVCGVQALGAPVDERNLGAIRVKSGDTLSHIAQLLEGRIYGKKGNLRRLARLNPAIPDPNHLALGTTVRLFPDARFRAEVGGSERKFRGIASLDPVPAGEDEAFRAHGALEIEPGFYYSAIRGRQLSNGSQGIFLSKLNHALTVRWRQYWRKNLETAVAFGWKKESYENNSGLITHVKNNEQNLSHLGLSARRGFGDVFWVNALAGFSQKIYYRGVGGGVAMETVATPDLQLGLGARILEVDPFSLEAQVSGTFTGAGKTSLYDVKSGTGYRGEISASQKWERFTGGAKFFYESRAQDTSYVEIKRQDMGLGLFFRWCLGK